MQPFENVRQLPQSTWGEAKGECRINFLSPTVSAMCEKIDRTIILQFLNQVEEDYHEETYESPTDMMQEQRKTCQTCGRLFHVLDCKPCYNLQIPRCQLDHPGAYLSFQSYP